MSIAALKESIESTLAGQGGEERVLSLERLAGGASRSIYQLALGAEGGADERSLVVRMAPVVKLQRSNAASPSPTYRLPYSRRTVGVS